MQSLQSLCRQALITRWSNAKCVAIFWTIRDTFTVHVGGPAQSVTYRQLWPVPVDESHTEWATTFFYVVKFKVIWPRHKKVKDVPSHNSSSYTSHPKLLNPLLVSELVDDHPPEILQTYSATRSMPCENSLLTLTSLLNNKIMMAQVVAEIEINLPKLNTLLTSITNSVPGPSIKSWDSLAEIKRDTDVHSWHFDKLHSVTQIKSVPFLR